MKVLRHSADALARRPAVFAEQRIEVAADTRSRNWLGVNRYHYGTHVDRE
jgi:hypothetical protein